jgi:plasmid stability protein
MASITIHNLEPELERQLKARARAEGASLNQLVKRLLEQSLGLRQSQQPHRKSFEAFLGVWSKDELRRFERTTEDFNKVEEEEWR